MAKSAQTTTQVIRKIPLYEDDGGAVHPSLVHSMFAWRSFMGPGKFRAHKPELDDSGNCIHCHRKGGYIDAHPYGVLRCICGVKWIERELNTLYRPYWSTTDDVRIEDIQPWGDDVSRKSVNEMLKAAREFETWPGRWLVLSGHYGTGKSHVLQWIANSLRPWSLYVTDYEFEQHAFRALNEKRYEDFVTTISNVPVLIYDDYGSGHGSDFGKSTMRKVIMYRYANAYDLPLAVGTNLKRGDNSLKLYDPRIADRFQDAERSNFVGLAGVKSWRSDR